MAQPQPPQPTTTDRPGIYLRFEMGLSWNARHTPKSRQVAYMSRTMRRRSTQFPRQLPPANTNFLATPQHQQQPGNAHQPQHQYQYQYQPQHHNQYQHAYPSQNHHHQPLPATYRYQSQSQPQDQHRHQPQLAAAGHHALSSQQDTFSAHLHPQFQPRRESRSRSRSSHERGSSAPPPLNDSPWDAEPEPMTATALPRRKHHPHPHLWKALPATPAQFRLGEDSLPWSPSLYPMGYVEDDEAESIAGPSDGRVPSNHRDPGLGHLDDRERGRATEIESLGAALMTVDNGFEDQWWFQGPRLVNIAGDLISSATMRELINHGGTVGWAVADQTASAPDPTSRQSHHLTSPQSSRIDIVSPLSDFSSPVSSLHGLRRSLTTRSDELHM